MTAHAPGWCMQGDRLDTDIVLGAEGGLKTIMPLTGVTTLEELNDAIKVRLSLHCLVSYVLQLVHLIFLGGRHAVARAPLSVHSIQFCSCPSMRLPPKKCQNARQRDFSLITPTTVAVHCSKFCNMTGTYIRALTCISQNSTCTSHV